MALLARADEVVVGDVQPGQHVLELRGVLLGQFQRRDARLLRRLLHLEAVHVHARHEIHGMAVEPLEARERVGRNRLVGVPDMRLRVRIGNRGGDGEMRFGCGFGHI